MAPIPFGMQPLCSPNAAGKETAANHNKEPFLESAIHLLHLPDLKHLVDMLDNMHQIFQWWCCPMEPCNINLTLSYYKHSNTAVLRQNDILCICQRTICLRKYVTEFNKRCIYNATGMLWPTK